MQSNFPIALRPNHVPPIEMPPKFHKFVVQIRINDCVSEYLTDAVSQE
jgi:hypothetical protein